MPRKKDDKLSMTFNGHQLFGEKFKDGWAWSCPDFPELAETFHHSAHPVGVIRAFTLLALAGTINVEETFHDL